MPASPTDDEDQIIDNPGEIQDEDAGKTTEQNEGGAITAESPVAEPKDDNKPASIADAVKAALAGGKEQSSSSGEGEGETGEEKDPKAVKLGGEEEPLGELTDEELASYKPRTQRRMKQFRDQVKTLSAENADLKPVADRYVQFDTWCKNANLTAEDINTGMNIMNLMKNTPQQAYEQLTPIYEKLRALVGVVLPPDLQQQVTEGKITAEAAQELSRFRASSSLTAAEKKFQDDRAKQDAEKKTQDDAAKFSVDVGLATTQWETRWKASDPDYPLKQARVSEAIELELLRLKDAGKLPTTIEGAVKMCDTVKARVEKEMKAYIPKKKAINPPPQDPGSTNGSKPRANSVYDAVAQAVGFN